MCNTKSISIMQITLVPSYYTLKMQVTISVFLIVYFQRSNGEAVTVFLGSYTGETATKPNVTTEATIFMEDKTDTYQLELQDAPKTGRCTPDHKVFQTCPPDLARCTHFGKTYCYSITGRKTYTNSKCPYNNSLGFHRHLWNAIVRDPVWIGIRNLEYGVGEFLYERPKSVVKEKIIYENDRILENGCLMYYRRRHVAVPCNSTLRRLCVYDESSFDGNKNFENTVEDVGVKVRISNERLEVVGANCRMLRDLHCYSDHFSGHLVDLWRKHKGNEGCNITHPVEATGYYWCSQGAVRSNKLFFERGYWYVTEVTVQYQIGEDPTSSSTAWFKYIRTLESNLRRNTNSSLGLRWMGTLSLNESDRSVVYLVHICTQTTNNSYFTYLRIKNNLWHFLEHKFVKAFPKLHDSKVCHRMRKFVNDSYLTWPETGIGNRTSPEELCLNEYGLPVLKKCGGSYYLGARWLKNEPCYAFDQTTSSVTKNLTELVSSDQPGNEIVTKLYDLSKNAQVFEPIDVFLASTILKKIKRSDNLNLYQVTDIVSNVMSISAEKLHESQMQMNATDRILYSYDVILGRNNKRYIGNVLKTKNLMVTVMDTRKTDQVGVVLLESRDKYVIEPLIRGTELEDVAAMEGIIVAVLFPEELIGWASTQNDPIATIAAYCKTSLFNQRDNEYRDASKNVAVLLPTKNDSAEWEVTVLFKTDERLVRSKRSCCYWNYGTRRKGSWTHESLPEELDSHLMLCKYNHTTHYGLLLSDERLEDSKVLDVITVIECTISLLGILAIFVTALCFKPWRRNKGNNILLNYSGISALQIVLFYTSYGRQESYDKALCVFVGAAMQYTVLSQFCWMLLIAVFQYRRYVRVLSAPLELRTPYILCFTAPALPVIVLVAFYRDAFVEGNLGFCYPNGDQLLYAVVLPTGLILLTNLTIFTTILVELLFRRSSQFIKDDTLVLRLRVLVFLFFTCGLTWCFGFLAQIFQSIVFEYAFCLTAPIQGFVQFLYFVALNRNTRRMYWALWDRRPCYHTYN